MPQHQQFVPEPARETHAQPDVLSELERRRREVKADVAEEARREGELEAARGAVAADEAAVQDRIDELLSSSPEDFVIRFIQTEGQ
jgi:hypothetical protein